MDFALIVLFNDFSISFQKKITFLFYNNRLIKILKEENEKYIKFYKNTGYFPALMIKFMMAARIMAEKEGLTACLQLVRQKRR